MGDDISEELKRAALAAAEKISVLEYQAVLDARAFNDFRVRIAAIADDFMPDKDSEASLALGEMRDALRAALIATNPKPHK